MGHPSPPPSLATLRFGQASDGGSEGMAQPDPIIEFAELDAHNSILPLQGSMIARFAAQEGLNSGCIAAIGYWRWSVPRLPCRNNRSTRKIPPGMIP